VHDVFFYKSYIVFQISDSIVRIGPTDTLVVSLSTELVYTYYCVRKDISCIATATSEACTQSLFQACSGGKSPKMCKVPHKLQVLSFLS